MDFEMFIPIAFFVMVVAIIKIITDHRLRQRLLETHASDELTKSLLSADHVFRIKNENRHSPLKWGLVLTLMGASFGLMNVWHLGPQDPATFGLLFAAAGLGLLIYYGLTMRVGKD